jgi:site-specific DNA recombinase
MGACRENRPIYPLTASSFLIIIYTVIHNHINHQEVTNMARPRKTDRERVYGLRAVIYLRVSTEEQAKEGNGLEAQNDACTAYAERLGYTVIATTRDDGISGTAGIDERPGLAEALRLCREHKADVLLCYAADRLSRSVGLFDLLRDMLIKAGVRFETVKEGQDFTKAESLLMGDIYSAFAAEERRRIAARLYGGRRVRSKRDGMGSGPIPYGYTMSGDGTIEIDRRAAHVICLLLDLRKIHTYQGTADALNDLGYTTPKGGKWTVGHVQGIERHTELYRTGVRKWDGVKAELCWPVICAE